METIGSITFAIVIVGLLILLAGYGCWVFWTTDYVTRENDDLAFEAIQQNKLFIVRYKPLKSNQTFYAFLPIDKFNKLLTIVKEHSLDQLKVFNATENDLNKPNLPLVTLMLRCCMDANIDVDTRTQISSYLFSSDVRIQLNPKTSSADSGQIRQADKQ